MIKGVARAVIKPGKFDAFMELAREFVALNRKEAGNIDYVLCQSLDNPDILTFMEIWEDMDALERHLRSEHFLRIAPQFAQLQEEATLADIYIEVL